MVLHFNYSTQSENVLPIAYLCISFIICGAFLTITLMSTATTSTTTSQNDKKTHLKSNLIAKSELKIQSKSRNPTTNKCDLNPNRKSSLGLP